MKFKKLLLGLGSLTAIVTPIATVVSCGEASSAQYSESDSLRMSNLRSSEAQAKLQELWLSKVLIQEYGIKNADGEDMAPLELLQKMPSQGSSAEGDSFIKDFESTLRWALKDKLFASKDALSSIYQVIKTSAPDTISGGTDGTIDHPGAVEALNVKVFERNEIASAVDNVFGIQNSKWEDVFYNHKTKAVKVKQKDGTSKEVTETTYNPSILGIKDVVLRMMVTKKFMTKTADQYKDKLPGVYAKINSKYRDATIVNSSDANFPLIVSAMNNRFAYKSSIDLEANKSKQFIVADGDNEFPTEAEAYAAFNKTSGKFASALTFTQSKETVVNDILARPIPSDFEVGFKGVSALPKGADALNTDTKDAIKLVKTEDTRDGFVVASKDETKIEIENIRYTDEDKTKIQLDYYTSLMPFMDNGKLAFGSSVNLDNLMNIAFSKDTALYSTAVEYFTSEGKADDADKPVLLKITNDWARQYYLDQGLKYIDDEK